MDSSLIIIHNILRWIMLPLLLFVLLRSYSGWFGDKPYTKLDKATGGALVGMAHLQLVLGLVLYFAVSPWFDMLKADFGGVMGDSVSRLKAIEHPLTMIIAVVLIQVGRTLSKKKTENTAKFKTVAIYTSIALVLILSRQINWVFPG
ncbi:MAG: hypothetical protein WED33_02165 [Bacteroidia bacterium]